jgi:ADP-ribose pyrophosphatase
MEYKLILREKIYQGHVIDLIVDHLTDSNNKTIIQESVEHPGGTVIIPVYPNGDILLIKQFRHPIKKEIFEFPAGKFEEGENPLRCAKRELAEETGQISSKWMRLGSLVTTPGFCNEILHIFLALDIEPSSKGQSLDENEAPIECLRYRLQDAVTMVEREEIVDAKTIIGVLYAERFFKKIME